MRLLAVDRLISGDGERVIDQGAICIDGRGVIVDVGTENELSARYPEFEITHYHGCTLLPGLIDLHVHIGYWYSKPDFMEYNDMLMTLLAASNLRSALSLGVTTIRDVASEDGLCRTLKYASKQKLISSPRIYEVNQGIIMTGGHGWQLKGSLREANGPWEVRTAVREQVRAGAEWIKLMTSHRTHSPEFTQEELDAAVGEAHRLGKKCCVHASMQPAIQMAIDAGFDTIEHATFMTVEQARQMKEKGLVWVPTMVTFFQLAEQSHSRLKKLADSNGMLDESLELYESFYIESEKAYRENFAKLLETGVKIATGTDIVLDKQPITPVADEIALMVELGMEPLRAIQAATQTAAEVLDQGHRFGTLAPGYVADILIVQGNPVVTIGDLKNVREVFLEGKSVFINTPAM
ncbi:amidohydrolase family protein [Brevibacillus sp. NRS-1366]|uniref:metal-dependent hydrolase family protein n=1 Tax=Brevibacillus sp. NRS-1366 TaxID=3233899 RepID=UPI003D25D9D0